MSFLVARKGDGFVKVKAISPSNQGWPKCTESSARFGILLALSFCFSTALFLDGLENLQSHLVQYRVVFKPFAPLRAMRVLG